MGGSCQLHRLLRTPAARRGEPSTNLLAGPDAPPRLGKFYRLAVGEERAHKTGDCEPTRLVNKQLSDLQKIPTPEGHSISELFRP